MLLSHNYAGIIHEKNPSWSSPPPPLLHHVCFLHFHQVASCNWVASPSCIWVASPSCNLVASPSCNQVASPSCNWDASSNCNQVAGPSCNWVASPRCNQVASPSWGWVSGGPKGLSRWLNAISPLQELEVGAHRVLYLLVFIHSKRTFVLKIKVSTYCCHAGPYITDMLTLDFSRTVIWNKFFFY